MSFFSFFTVLSNTLVATVLTCELTSRESAARRWFLQPWVSSGVAVSIARGRPGRTAFCCAIYGIPKAGNGWPMS